MSEELVQSVAGWLADVVVVVVIKALYLSMVTEHRRKHNPHGRGRPGRAVGGRKTRPSRRVVRIT